ncbi:MAG: M13 family peptidase, partial [Clostridium butyricum]|nr:M13 family peptidase [Clostridium butyricum]
MKKNRRIVSLLAGAAVIISMITPLSKGYAEERTGTYDLKTVNISNVRAQDDFYEAVNGEWTKNEANNINDLYGEKSTYSDIKENNDKIVKSEFESFLHNKNKYGENSDERKMADVYENYINREARNSQGIE